MPNKLFTLSSFVLLLSGCSFTIPVYPEFQAVNPANRINKTFNHEVQLINDQKINEQKYFSDYSTHKVEGNMYLWTDQVIELTKYELEKRNGFVIKESEKKLYLSFNANEVEDRNFVVVCKGTLSVKTSSGYEKSYSVKNGVPAVSGIPRACGGAITLSVIELLNDKNIHDFLNYKAPQNSVDSLDGREGEYSSPQE